MLLRELDDDAAIAIGQPAHAWVSGQLARAWGNERFGEVVPREDVCLGAEQHDIGMALWDREPTLNRDSGRPHTFMEMPLHVHLELWGAAPQRIVMQSRYAALLVSMHGTALYERRNLDRLEPARANAIRAYLREQHELQERLLAQLRRDTTMAESAAPALIERNQRLVFCWDWLSLALCLRWAPDRFDGVPAADGTTSVALRETSEPDVVTLDPWPFAAAELELKAEGRILRGRYTDEGAMRAALAAADPVTLRFKVVQS
jgi:hypothetical protein